MGFDAKMEGYDLVEVDGRVCLFSYMRLDRNSVPEGIFCYEVEDSEREDCSFGKIKERVEHRRMGSILCREKLPIGADGKYPLQGKAANWGGWGVSSGKSCKNGRRIYFAGRISGDF